MSDANYRPGDLAAYLSKNAKTKHRIVDEESRKNEKKGSKRRKKNNDDDAIEESTKLINLFDKHRDRQPSIPQGISSINTIKKERTAENDNLTLTKSKKRQKLDVSRQSTIDTTDQKRSKKTNMDSAEVCERTVFVGNVPLETKKRAIHKLFAVFGPIDSIRLRSVVSKDEKLSKRVAAVTHQLSTHQHCLHFYVKFATKDAAKAAIQLNGSAMGEHRLRVDICTSDGSAPNYDTKLTIFVGNLPFDIRENQLIEHFSACVGDNDIDFVRIIRDRMTGVGKGIAFVAFKNVSAAQLALTMNERQLNGRSLRVTRLPIGDGKQSVEKKHKKVPIRSKMVRKKIAKQQKRRKKSLMTK